MTLYVGETITVRCDATDKTTGLVIDDAVGEVEFYAPGKNPSKVPDDREADHDANMTFDITTSSYIVHVNTTDWAAGKWTYRVKLTAQYVSWEYGSFTLRA